MTYSLPCSTSEPLASSFAIRSTAQTYDTRSVAHLQAGYWVQLLELPSPFSFDEALLLCPCSDDHWLVWIPDHGEMTLHIRQFCARG